MQPGPIDNAKPIYCWRVRRQIVVLGIGLLVGFHLVQPNQTVAYRLGLVRRLVALPLPFLTLPLVGLIIFILVPFCFLYGIGGIIGHTVPFVVSIIVGAAVAFTFVFVLAALVYFRLRLHYLEQQNDQANYEFSLALRADPTLHERRSEWQPVLDNVNANLTYTREQMLTTSAQFVRLMRWTISLWLGLMFYAILSPASPLIDSFGGGQPTFSGKVIWIIDRYWNWLFADFPEAVIGKTSQLEPQTFMSRVCVWIVKILTIASVIANLVVMLRPIWKRDHEFVGTKEDFRIFIDENALFRELDNLNVTCVGEVQTSYLTVDAKEIYNSIEPRS